MRKQILIIEDLGIPEAVFNKRVAEMRLDYDSVRDNPDPKAVEVIISVKKRIDSEMLKRFPNLKMIGVAFTGYDSVDLDACREMGVAVYNVPAYSTHSVAELAVGLTISLLRDIPQGNQQIRHNQWNMPAGNELYGKTVGILGTGKIGLASANLFKAFGCKLLGWSRTEKEEFKALGGEYIWDKQQLFAKADIISVHVPYNAHTAGLVGVPELKSMKKTAFLVNTARGPIVDEDALLNTLKNKEIAGAALDVFSIEPIPADHPFLALDNVILTPHIAFKTEEALERRAEVTLQNIQDFLTGTQGNRVN